ncbi:unnamed protein product [Urochloa decumbens]|uniref:F-box protein AT5G49610-like beta-propeller domain-containing protein n=1 Tax=Urochloa decumbens TaxID=240449 RepID=A0ABC9A1T4_9POAL
MATKISSPPAAADAMPTSKVLGDVDLLGEILRRVDSPSTLVRAALVSRRWLRAASARDFLRRFRALHPPRLIGFYVSGDCVPRPEFVPMPAPAPPHPPDRELSAAQRRASTRSGFDAFPEFSSTVWDCWDGRVLFDFTETVHGSRRFGVRDPLRHPDRGVTELPPPPPTWPQPECPHAMLFPDDSDGDAACYRLHLRHSGATVSATVGVLRSGAWSVHCSAEAVLPAPPERIPMLTTLAAGKIYTVAVVGYVLGLDMAAARFFVVELPAGVAYEYYGNLVPCRGGGGGGSALYLVHLKGDRLCVWLRRRMDEHGAGDGEWVLRDAVSLRETCGHLVEQGLEPAAGHAAVASVVGVGDDAKFVFLELHASGVFVYMHFGSRKVEKVYQRDPDNDEITLVYPCSMAWLPVFPALLDEGESEPEPLREEKASS